jgi:hypothetical protein
MFKIGCLIMGLWSVSAWTPPSASALALQGAIDKAIAQGDKEVALPDGDIFFNGA